MPLDLTDAEARRLEPAVPRAVRALAAAALCFRRIDEVCEEVAEELQVASPWDDPHVRVLAARRDRCVVRLVALNRELVDLALERGIVRDQLLPPAPDVAGLVAARAAAADAEEHLDRVERWAAAQLDEVAAELELALGGLRARLAGCASAEAARLDALVTACQAACRTSS